MTEDSLKSLRSEFFQKYYNGSSDASMEHEEKVIFWTESTLFLLYTFCSLIGFILYINCQRECDCHVDIHGYTTLWSQEDSRYVGFILMLTTWFSGALSLIVKVPWWIFYITLSVLSIYLALMFVNYLIIKCRRNPEELDDVVVENPRRCSNLLFRRMQCRAAEHQDQPAFGRRLAISVPDKQSKPKKTQ